MGVLRGCKWVLRRGNRGFLVDPRSASLVGSKSLLFIFLFIIAVMQCSCSGYRSTLSPRISLTEEFTTNRDLSSTDTESDFISTITPGMTYSLAGETRALHLGYDPSFLFYATRDGTFASRHAAELRAWDQFAKRSRFELMDTFLRTDDAAPTRDPRFDRTEDVEVPTDFTIRQGTEEYSRNFANARFRHDFGLNDSLLFDYTHSLLDNDDSALEDNTYHEPALGLTYFFTPQYGIDTRASYTRGDFSSDTGEPSDSINEFDLRAKMIRKLSPHFDVFFQYDHVYVDFEGDTPDYQVYVPSVGVDYHLSQTIFLGFRAGYFFQDVDQGDGESGYIVQGDAAREFSWGSVRLSGGGGYDQAFFGAENLGFSKFYQVNLAAIYQFARHLSGEASTTYRHNEYTLTGREDDQFSFLAGLNYQFRPWLRAALRYTFRNVDSSDELGSYDENRVALTITLAPETPILLGR